MRPFHPQQRTRCRGPELPFGALLQTSFGPRAIDYRMVPTVNQDQDGSDAMWTKLQQIPSRIVSSSRIEATYDPFSYHEPARAGALRFSPPSWLRRYY